MFDLIASLDQKFVSKETFSLHNQSQIALQRNAAAILDVVDSRSERIADAVEALATRQQEREAAPSFLADQA